MKWRGGHRLINHLIDTANLETNGKKNLHQCNTKETLMETVFCA